MITFKQNERLSVRYLSLFSGIEAATVAWESLGWQAVAFSELDKFPSALLAEKYPDIPNLGDVTKITEDQIKALGPIDLVVFGSPCQNLSVSGNRKGFNGSRSSLFRDAWRIIQWCKQHNNTRYALWENVPGAFSSNKGADFSEVVSTMAGLNDIGVPKNGWGKEGAALGDEGLLEWSILDAQWFGLAQRRKRVFAIVDFGEWFSRSPILLERESVRGNSPPSREMQEDITRASQNAIRTTSGEDVYPTLLASSGAKGFIGNQEAFNGKYYLDHPLIKQSSAYFNKTGFSSFKQANYCSTLTASDTGGSGGLLCFKPGASSRLGGNVWDELSPTLLASGNNDNHPCIAFAQNQRDEVRELDQAGALQANAGMKQQTFVAYSIDAPKSNSMKSANPNSGCREVDFAKTIDTTTPCPSKNQGNVAVIENMRVRRLTPLECERLMGFPDGYTAMLSNTQRYKALGNSMAVPVMRWIGERIVKNSS